MQLSDQQVLAARITVPEHVVRRVFAEESIVLNLQSGQYNGTNATATAMLEALESGERPGAVAARVASAAGEPCDRVTSDLLGLLRALADRGLVEVHAGRDA